MGTQGGRSRSWLGFILYLELGILPSDTHDLGILIIPGHLRPSTTDDQEHNVTCFPHTHVFAFWTLNDSFLWEAQAQTSNIPKLRGLLHKFLKKKTHKYICGKETALLEPQRAFTSRLIYIRSIFVLISLDISTSYASSISKLAWNKISCFPLWVILTPFITKKIRSP